jgi:hypothetical protein
MAYDCHAPTHEYDPEMLKEAKLPHVDDKGEHTR